MTVQSLGSSNSSLMLSQRTRKYFGGHFYISFSQFTHYHLYTHAYIYYNKFMCLFSLSKIYIFLELLQLCATNNVDFGKSQVFYKMFCKRRGNLRKYVHIELDKELYLKSWYCVKSNESI